jgi:2-dehydro-3-deoxyphosphooctonate aldolase (KDO 8-P synthase)
MHTESREIRITDDLVVGGAQPLFLIGGPCVIESEEHALRMAGDILAVCKDLSVPFIFKASFDKANRSSIHSFRGPGLKKGLAVLEKVKTRFGVPVLSDIHETSQVEDASAVLDVLQIPAFLCRQTDLLLRAAATGRPLNIKKGQFLAPWDMVHVTKKVQSTGNDAILLTERGASFGYNNLVFDPRSVPIMKELGFPVIIDASHSVQRPGGLGTSSGGDRRFIPTIARAGVASGADGLFLEIHDRPESALSDGPNSLYLNELKDFLRLLQRIRETLDPINREGEEQ